ncbi:MAG: RIP metalloprotease RseP [Firmicutes bacterium]|nr:RIP metalloprotease RseP [Bacillota bacterium]
MQTFIASIVVFGLLIFIHELGHFLAAKLMNIKVHEFSLGFGPKLVSLPRGETSYNVRALPLGGFVRMAGMDPNEEEPDEERGFNKKTVGQRVFVIFAGPAMNFVLAALLLAFIFFFQGIPVPLTTIESVVPGYPAESAGILPGDKVVAVDNVPVGNWNELAAKINSRPEEKIQLTVLREGREKNFEIYTIRDENGQGKIGIVPARGPEKLSVPAAIAEGWKWTARITVMILTFLSKMIFGAAPADLGGPVRVVTEIGKAVEVGYFFVVELAAFLSINLGLFNLFPIPALDGSRILFLTWEKIRGRPVDPVKENFIHLVGFGLLMLLMIIITYNDILQIFIEPKVPMQR